MVLVNTSLPLRLIVFDVSVAYVPGINLQRKDPALTVKSTPLGVLPSSLPRERVRAAPRSPMSSRL